MGLAGIDRNAAYRRLELYGLLCPETDEALDVCEAEWLTVLEASREKGKTG